ncbi:hypothetical protein GCM10027610_054860 [Dactylosporangium cerinum]
MSVSTPLTLEPAENEPIRSGRSADRHNAVSNCAGSTRPDASAPIRTMSAVLSRQSSSLEWCSYGPTNTTGRACDCVDQPGDRVRMRNSLSIALVAPEPQKITACVSSPPTPSSTSRRASSRSWVVRRPVAEASVWVLAYHGTTWSRRKSSMNDRALPEAVWSA